MFREKNHGRDAPRDEARERTKEHAMELKRIERDVHYLTHIGSIIVRLLVNSQADGTMSPEEKTELRAAAAEIKAKVTAMGGSLDDEVERLKVPGPTGA